MSPVLSRVCFALFTGPSLLRCLGIRHMLRGRSRDLATTPIRFVGDRRHGTAYTINIRIARNSRNHRLLVGDKHSSLLRPYAEEKVWGMVGGSGSGDKSTDIIRHDESVPVPVNTR
jgi:hypothetical protein